MPSRLLVCILVPALLLLLARPLASQQQPDAAPSEIPDVVYQHPEESPPLWVRMDQAITPSGKLTELVRESDLEAIARWLVETAPALEDCIDLPPSSHQGIEAHQTLDHMVAWADGIIVGRVTDSGRGFYYGIPGTLLQIEPVEWLRAPSNVRQRDDYFIFVGAGVFEIGDDPVCVYGSDWADLPEKGEEVIAFFERQWGPDGRFLWTSYGAGIVTLRADGRVSVPAPQRSSLHQRNISGKDAYLALLRAEIRGDDE